MIFMEYNIKKIFFTSTDLFAVFQTTHDIDLSIVFK